MTLKKQSFDDYLARLLLLQNIAALLPYRGLDDFVCQGLIDFPGVKSVRWEKDHALTRETDSLNSDSLALPLKYSNSCFGTIYLGLSDHSLIAPYIPYLHNFVVMMAVLLETKRKEAAAKAVQDRFFELAPDLLCIANTKGFLTTLSNSWETTLGWTLAELCSRPFMDFVHPEDVKPTNQTLAELAEGKHIAPFSNRYRHKDGSYRWLEWIAHPAAENTIFAVARDVTENRLVEHKLKLAASVFNNTNDAIFVCDQLGTILSANKSFLAVSGYSESEIVGQNISIFDNHNQHDAVDLTAILRKIDNEAQWVGEIGAQNKAGGTFLSSTHITRVSDSDSHTETKHFICIMRDITTERAHEKRIQELAYYDSLTGLANRTLLLDRLDHAIFKANRSQKKIAVLYIDLDDFKSLNDSLGHDVGDTVLTIQAQRLQNYVRKSDTVARTSGDEFVVLVELDSNIDFVTLLASKILATLSIPIDIGKHTFRSTCSIGISFYPNDGKDRVTLMRNADAAMFTAKQHGRNVFRFFSSDMTEKANERLQLETELRNALTKHELEMHYQPKIDFRTSQVIGAEALIRWNHPTRGLLYPGQFIPFAEESNLIIEIGQYVIETVIAQIAEWRTKHQALPIAINISAAQFAKNNLSQEIQNACLEYKVPENLLEVEVTESVIMNDPELASSTLQELRNLGIRIAIDDFGTGHSSLAYLKRLPLDQLKIDRAFVKDIHTNEEDLQIAKTIIALAKSLRLSTIAEGIELESHARILKTQGVDFAQGFLYSKALPAIDFMRLFNNQNKITS